MSISDQMRHHREVNDGTHHQINHQNDIINALTLTIPHPEENEQTQMHHHQGIHKTLFSTDIIFSAFDQRTQN